MQRNGERSEERAQKMCHCKKEDWGWKETTLAKWLLEFLGIPTNEGVNFHGKFGLGIPRNSQP